MAKGNLFQGMARGKVGDVVFYRMNGVQMSRLRNRAPKNPRSNEQLYQRCIIATTMKAYSAGKEIFDHAFQGYTVGEGCMRRFNSVNARILRAGLIADLYKEPDTTNYRFVAPAALYPAPTPGIQISEGTLEQKLFVISGGMNGDPAEVELAPNTLSATTINKYLDNIGTYAGDIYTFVFFLINKNNIAYRPEWTDSDYAKQFACYFGYVRLTIKSDIPNDLAFEGAKFQDVFNIEVGGAINTFNGTQSFEPGTGITLQDQVGLKYATIGIIRSRLDEDIRSTAYMYTYINNDNGIAAPYVLEIWQNQVSKVGASELILEGGDGANGVPASTANMPEGLIAISPVDEQPVRKTARHRGTRNNKE